MPFFSDFFLVNNKIVLFVYGLVFFILGFAILLQVRQSSRLEIARHLRWLAAFGILHGMYEWGDLFIPMQEEYLSAQMIEVIHILHLILLALSFTCLFEFGLSLLFPLSAKQIVHWQTVLVFLTWLAASAYILPFDISNEYRKYHIANALARYFIQFPGGIISAYGLRVHALTRIAPLNAPQITRMFQVTGISIFLYTLVAGLIPPPVPFFPGNIINARTFTDFVGIPPMVFRSLTGLAITATLLRGLEIFDLEAERRIEQLEQQQIIQSERERLARDLHDGAIQKVYTAGLLTESAARLAEKDSEIDKRLTRAVAVISDAILDLRRNLSELHTHSRLEQTPFSQFLCDITSNSHYNTMVHITVKSELPESKTLSAWRVNHICAIINEALANAVRHANASSVEIIARDMGDSLLIEIKDNGTGLPVGHTNGYGLRNISDRARLLNGKIDFITDKGLTVSLQIPWSNQQ